MIRVTLSMVPHSCSKELVIIIYKNFNLRNNIFSKLVGTFWGAILRTATLVLTTSVHEYCAPVWYKSSHTHEKISKLMKQ